MLSLCRNQISIKTQPRAYLYFYCAPACFPSEVRKSFYLFRFTTTISDTVHKYMSVREVRNLKEQRAHTTKASSGKVLI